MKTKVKICGIRTVEHAQAAVTHGADFLGFVFVPHTKNSIAPEEVKKIINTLKMENGQLNIALVGVFQNQSVEEVNNIAEKLGLDFVQLHGEENVNYIARMSKKVIKRIKEDVAEIKKYTVKPVCYFLLDRKIRGEGEMVDLKKAKEIALKANIFFAGGLTPDNIVSVVEKVDPFAVDVCSGVMTNRVGDTDKIKRFIQNAKGVEI